MSYFDCLTTQSNEASESDLGTLTQHLINPRRRPNIDSGTVRYLQLSRAETVMPKPSYSTPPDSSLGLVLSGGGARGAYQAGAVKALYEIADDCRLRHPFSVLTGVSAGAINAVFLASTIDNPLTATTSLADLWSHIRTDQVFHTDIANLTTNAWQWVLDIMTGSTQDQPRPRGLLNTTPLEQLLRTKIKFPCITENLRNGVLNAVSVSAMNYATAEAVVFFQARRSLDAWKRSQRASRNVTLGIKHAMASAAIPLFFPPISLHGSFYADGSLRNLAPLSAALHLGADRLIAIGVRERSSTSDQSGEVADQNETLSEAPSVARILSVLLNAVLMDALDSDLERLRRINRTVSLLSPDMQQASHLRMIPNIYLSPSQDLAKIASEEAKSLPNSIRFLLHGLGPDTEGADLLSYLMFEPSFCSRLVNLGYSDTLARRDEIADFLRKDREPGVSPAPITTITPGRHQDA